jgi:tetratricopeptide (TPR) repeat protein
MFSLLKLFRCRSFVNLTRTFILIFSFIALTITSLIAQKKDSALLFSRLSTNDEHKKLQALQDIFHEYYGFYPFEGYPYMLQALSLSRKLDDKQAQAIACLSISFYYSCRGMIDSADYFCKVGMELGKILNSTPLLARGYGRLGYIYRTKGEKLKAVESLKKAIMLDSLNQELVANCCMNLGIIYGDAGSPEKAVFYYLKALSIREKQNKLIDAGYLSCNLAGFYFQTSSKDQGYKYYEKGLQLFRQAKFATGESYAYNCLGMIYFENKDWLSALTFYRKSIAINDAGPHPGHTENSFTLTNIGDTWLKMKRYDSAAIYYAKSLKLSSMHQDWLPLSCTYLSMGDLNTQLKNYPKAIEYLNQGLYYSRMINYRAQWEQAYQLLSECYEAEGQHDKALIYLKKHDAIRDSIFTEKAHREVANMMIRYETQKKDEQISKLNDDSRTKQAKIRIAIFIILVIILITGIVAYFTWVYYNKKLRPKVNTLNFIQQKINIEKEGDNRRLRALDKVLPPELRPFTNDPPPETESEKDLIVKLEALLINDKVYLNESLTLTETARLLCSNTAYLSKLINEHYEVNFSAFINRYRIEEAKRMILNDHFNNFSIEGIAKSSGFRSKSTFNQVFKAATGLTPTEFAHRNGKVRA